MSRKMGREQLDNDFLIKSLITTYEEGAFPTVDITCTFPEKVHITLKSMSILMNDMRWALDYLWEVELDTKTKLTLMRKFSKLKEVYDEPPIKEFLDM